MVVCTRLAPSRVPGSIVGGEGSYLASAEDVRKAFYTVSVWISLCVQLGNSSSSTRMGSKGTMNAPDARSVLYTPRCIARNAKALAGTTRWNIDPIAS